MTVAHILFDGKPTSRMELGVQGADFLILDKDPLFDSCVREYIASCTIEWMNQIPTNYYE